MPPPRVQTRSCLNNANPSNSFRSVPVLGRGASGGIARNAVLDSKMSFPKNTVLSSPRYGEHLEELEANLARLNAKDLEEEDDVDPNDFGLISGTIPFESEGGNTGVGNIDGDYSPFESGGRDCNEGDDALSPNSFAKHVADREAALAVSRTYGE